MRQIVSQIVQKGALELADGALPELSDYIGAGDCGRSVAVVHVCESGIGQNVQRCSVVA